MGQSEQFHEQWQVMRDLARPVLEIDVDRLTAAREFSPPSKAHLKRLARFRPDVTVAVPRPAPDVSRRREINQAAAHGVRIAALVGYVKPIVR